MFLTCCFRYVAGEEGKQLTRLVLEINNILDAHQCNLRIWQTILDIILLSTSTTIAYEPMRSSAYSETHYDRVKIWN